MRNKTPLLFRIGFRVLLMNVLIVFVPIVVLLLLDTYEQQLLDVLERGLVQQARTIAAALSLENDVDAPSAGALLGALGGRHESRIRIVDAAGTLLSDSSSLGAESQPAGASPAADTPAESLRDPADTREQLLYRIASTPVRWFRTLAGDPNPALESADFYVTNRYADGREVQAALAGGYGAATRISTGGQISVTLYSAIPVRIGGEVRGAVLVSQSTFRILQNLYQVRADVFLVFLLSLAVAVVLSVFLSLTIARPLARLRLQARNAVDHRGRLTAPILRATRRDEIGSLSAALSELTQQVDSHTRAVESFASDVAHELKNPLASIRASCELAASAGEERVRSQFLNQAEADVMRCQRIIEAIRELSQIDSGREPESTCEVQTAVAESVAWCKTAHPSAAIDLTLSPESCGLHAGIGAARLRQVMENLLDNAVGLSPAHSPVTVRVTLAVSDSGGQPLLVIAVADRGAGLPAGDEERVFDRFYTGRTRRDGHLGLGLAIVRTLVERAGGVVRGRNRTGGGACFEVELPIVPEAAGERTSA